MLKKITWTFSANMVTALVKWLMLVVIAQYLTTYDVGAYALALAVTSPIMLFANMKLRSVYVSDVTPNYRAYTIARNGVGLFSLLVIIIIVAIFYPSFMAVIMMVSVIKGMELISDLMYALAHRAQRMRYIAVFTMIKQLLLLLSFWLTIAQTTSLIWGLRIQVVLFLLFLPIEYYYFTMAFSHKKTATKQQIYRVLQMGIPLGLTQLVVSFNAFFPRYILEYVTSPQMLGIFSAIAYITVVANIVMGAVSQNFLSYFSRHVAQQNWHKIIKTLRGPLLGMAIVLSVALLVVSLVAGKFLLTLFYGEPYGQHAVLLVWMSICIFFNALNWNMDTLFISVTILRKQLYFALCGILITVPVSLLCINYYGVTGAALAMIISSAAQYMIKRAYFTKWLASQEGAM